MKLRTLSQSQAIASVRKPMPQPSQAMTVKNAYKRREKHKRDFRWQE